MLSKRDLIVSGISIGSYNDFIETIMDLAISGESSYVCVANVHMLIEAYLDSKFASIVNDADIVTPDGMPLTKALKLLYGISQDRVAGMDLLPDLLKISAKKNVPVFFYGGSQHMLDETQKYLDKYIPESNLAGMYSPPFRSLTENEQNTIIDIINHSGAKLVFIVLGCPKQEKWMASMKGKISATMVGIGGALPVLVGLQKRAPLWMQKSSLEWLYRFYQEPRRLFKRYAVTNSIFIFLMAKQLIKKMLSN